jgi:hypothetical protein
MKKILILLICLKVVSFAVDSNSTIDYIDNINNIDNIDNIDNTDTIETNQEERTFTQFEKTFIYHTAYNHYKKAIDLMYKNNHKDAYTNAMIAKDIYDYNATKTNEIILPHIPGYIRQSAQAPTKINYKIFETKNYELKRLIRKIKLLNPPIPLVVFAKTSTYIDITVENFGDLPLDNFTIFINGNKAHIFKK